MRYIMKVVIILNIRECKKGGNRMKKYSKKLLGVLLVSAMAATGITAVPEIGRAHV